MLEKRGVIDEHTPHCGDGSGDGSGCKVEPLSKEGADALERHPGNDLADAIEERSRQNAQR